MLILFKYARLVFKCVGGTGPSCLSELLTPKSSDRSSRSDDAALLYIPKSRTVSYGDRSFRVAGPRVWNSLPIDHRKATDLKSFKRGLKTPHFETHYNE